MRLTQAVLLAGCFLVAQFPAQAATLTRGPYLQSCTSTSVVVRWRTDALVDSRVRFHPADDDDELEVVNLTLGFGHEIQLTGLSPDTRYFYSVASSAETLATGTNYYFHTHPTNARPVRVWAIGDSGSGGPPQFAVRDSYMRYTNSASTDVWLMLGDNVYGDADEDDYQTKLFDVYSDLLAHTVLWPALGNHDAPLGTPFPYLDIFTLPRNGEAGGVPSHSEMYYSFDFANVHFVCLDSWLSDRSSSGAMCNWLRADLAATSQDWIIVYWHHPPYSMGTDFSDWTPILIEMREQVVPILESFGVDLVLSGHSHVYERSFLLNGHYGHSWTLSPTNILDFSLGHADAGGAYLKPPLAMGVNRGTIYTVCGNSGQGGPVSFQRHPAMATYLAQYGSVVLDIDGLRLSAKYLRPNGAIDDYFTIDKSAPVPVPLAMSVEPATNALAFVWPAASPDFALESSTSLLSTNWSPVTKPRLRFGRTNRVNLPMTNNAAFFRLRAAPH